MCLFYCPGGFLCAFATAPDENSPVFARYCFIYLKRCFILTTAICFIPCAAFAELGRVCVCVCIWSVLGVCVEKVLCLGVPISQLPHTCVKACTGTAQVQETCASIIDNRRKKKWWQSNEIINVAELMMNENKKSRGSLEPASSLAMQSHHILFWSRQALGLFPSLP